MKKVLVLGAYGQIARVATALFLEKTDAFLTLYLRKSNRLGAVGPADRVCVVDGDVLDKAALTRAMKGQDVVYANLSGNMAAQARLIIDTMKEAGVRRLIFISSMGIYNEVPTQSYHRALDPYRDSALLIENSGLDYTIIRPEWLNDRDEVDYDTTQKGEVFLNPTATVSRKSVADLVVKLATTDGLEIGHSLGIHKTL